MAEIVLVHGGWAGAWQWEKLVPLLEQEARRVFRPCLSGLGSKAEEANPEISVQTHIEDVIKLFLSYKLEEVILLGFSYAGLVVSGVLHRIPERISRLIYLDAFYPHDGESFADIVGPKITRQFKQFSRIHGEGWKVPAFKPDDERLVPQPIKTALFPIPCDNPHSCRVPRWYIRCTKKDPDWTFTPILEANAVKARKDGCKMAEIACGHFAMNEKPRELAGIIEEICGSR